MEVIPEKTYGSFLIGWDYSHGKDAFILIVGQKRDNQAVEIINKFQGEEAYKMYEKLTTVKTKKEKFNELDPKRLGCIPVKNEKGEFIGRVLSVDTDKGTFVADIDDDETIRLLAGKECSVEVVKA